MAYVVIGIPALLPIALEAMWANAFDINETIDLNHDNEVLRGHNSWQIVTICHESCPGGQELEH